MIPDFLIAKHVLSEYFDQDKQLLWKLSLNVIRTSWIFFRKICQWVCARWMSLHANSRIGMAERWLWGSISSPPLRKEKRSMLTGCDSLLLLSESGARLSELCSAVAPPTVPTLAVGSDAQCCATRTPHITHSMTLHWSTASLAFNRGGAGHRVVAFTHTKQQVYLAGQLWQNNPSQILFSVCRTHLYICTCIMMCQYWRFLLDWCN